MLRRFLSRLKQRFTESSESPFDRQILLENADRKNGVILSVQLLSLGGALIAALLNFLSGELSIALIFFGAGWLLVISMALLRLGYPRLAGLLLMFAMLLAVQLLLITGNGVHDISMLLYPMILLVASLLFNIRSYLLILLLVIGSVAGTAWAEITGRLATPYAALSDLTDPVELMVLFAIFGAIIYLISDYLTQNLRQLRQNQKALAQSLEREHRLSRLGQAISSTLDMGAVLENLTRLGAELLEADAGALSLVSEDEQEIKELYDYNIPEGLSGRYLERGEGLTWHLILNRQPLLAEDYGSLPDALPELAQAGARGVIGAPLMLGERCLGALMFLRYGADAPPFQPTDLELLQNLTQQAVFAIRNAQLYRAVVQRDGVLRAATYAAERFLLSRDWRESIDEVLAQLGEPVRASHAYLFELRRDADGSEYATLTHEWTAAGQTPDLGKPLYQRVSLDRLGSQRWRQTLEAGEPFIGRRTAFPAAEQQEVDPQIRTFLQLPVFVEDRWWGVIGLDDCQEERRWGSMEVDALRVTAGVLSAAIRRQQAEAALRQLNAELEERVSQRTQELQLANQEMQSFAYSVSHDLRAPLRSIDGYSKLLLEDYAPWLDEQGQAYVRSIRQATQRMGRLIDDLLKLSRLTRQEMRLQVVDLSALCQEVLEELQGGSHERMREVSIQPGMWTRADPNLLRILLTNLLSNACKFTAQVARPRIEIGMLPLNERRAERVFFVKDNGVGFDMKYQERLFRPFERLHTEHYEGTGIGLATVWRIVQRHGGRIWAEAAPGRGATFYWTLGENNRH